MGAGRASGRTDLADHLTDPDDVAVLDVDLGEMAIACRQAVAVVDLDHAAITAAPARRDHLAIRGCAHGIACLRAEIEAGVHGRTAEERIRSHAEAGGE